MDFLQWQLLNHIVQSIYTFPFFFFKKKKNSKKLKFKNNRYFSENTIEIGKSLNLLSETFKSVRRVIRPISLGSSVKLFFAMLNFEKKKFKNKKYMFFETKEMKIQK